MTMPTDDRIPAYADRLLENARQVVAEPDNLSARRRFAMSSFNIDWTAAAIILLAERQPPAP